LLAQKTRNPIAVSGYAYHFEPDTIERRLYRW
jgi:hypothetical protein